MPGQITIYTTNIASGSNSAVFDVSRSWKRIYLDIGSMTTASSLSILGSQNGTTFRNLNLLNVATQPVSFVTLIISASLADNMVEIPVHLRYFKVNSDAVVSGGVSLS